MNNSTSYFEDHLKKYIDFSSDSPGGGGLHPLNAAFWLHLLLAQNNANVNGDILEIGVWHGYTASLLASQLRPDETIGLIDIFMNYDQFTPNISRFTNNSNPNIKFWKQSSFDIRKKHDPLEGIESLRFVHIDGEHSYEAVENDFRLCIDKLSDSGVIVFDDIFLDRCPQLTEALFLLLTKYRSEIVMFAVGLGKAYLCRPRALGFYRDVTKNSPIALQRANQYLQICVAGWSIETTYYGLSSREPAQEKWLIMNRMTDDITLVP